MEFLMTFLQKCKISFSMNTLQAVYISRTITVTPKSILAFLPLPRGDNQKQTTMEMPCIPTANLCFSTLVHSYSVKTCLSVTGTFNSLSSSRLYLVCNSNSALFIHHVPHLLFVKMVVIYP